MTLTRPRVRPGFARWSTVAFVVLLPFVAHAVWDYVEARRLRARIDAIAARGEPLTDRALAGVRLTRGAEDSERYYRAAAALAADLYRDIPSATSHRIATAERDGVWPPDLLAIVRAKVDHYLDALALVDRAAPLPFEGFLPGRSYTYQMSGLFTLARLCDWRAAVRAADGDGDGAAESLYSEARLARALQWPPSFRALPSVLEDGHPSAAARARLADALVPLDRDDGLVQEFLRMRAVLVGQHQFDRAAWSSPMRTLRMHTLVRLLDEYTALARAAERP